MWLWRRNKWKCSPKSSRRVLPNTWRRGSKASKRTSKTSSLVIRTSRHYHFINNPYFYPRGSLVEASIPTCTRKCYLTVCTTGTDTIVFPVGCLSPNVCLRRSSWLLETSNPHTEVISYKTGIYNPCDLKEDTTSPRLLWHSTVRPNTQKSIRLWTRC